MRVQSIFWSKRKAFLGWYCDFEVIPTQRQQQLMHFLEIKHQGLVLLSSRIDTQGTEATRIYPRVSKDRSLGLQKMKTTGFSHYNLFYTIKAWYKNPFLLCIIVHTDSNMYTCVNKANLCWLGNPYLRNNNYWKKLS